MTSALANANVDGDSIGVILKAISDMQDKINADTDKKLDNFVKRPDFNDLDGLVQSANRRIQHNEGIVKNLNQLMEQNADLIDGNKKRIARL